MAQAGGQAISSFAGSITQSGSTTSSGQFTTSLLKIEGDCFTTSSVVPLQGNNNAGALTLNSYEVNGQTVVLTSNFDTTLQTMSGTYAVYGGCGDGARGTFNAARYGVLNGTFQGILQSSGPMIVSAALSQVQTSTGNGTFLLTGNLTIQGSSTCTFSGAAPAASSNYVQGNYLQATFNSASGSGSLQLTGNLDAMAKHLTNLVISGTVSACSAPTTTGSLSM